MKMRCECGHLLYDQTDALPHKAHLIPDQELFSLFDAVDDLMCSVASGDLTPEAAGMALRRLHGEVSRPVYQCSACGRLLVMDQDRHMHCYAPGSPPGRPEILSRRTPPATALNT